MLRCAVLLALSACGRLSFDIRGDASGTALDDGGGDSSIAPAPLSCIDLPTTCGPTNDAPCCDSLMVPAASYHQNYDVGTDGTFPNMNRPTTVSAFRLDTYEVTVGRFRQFVNAGMGTQQNPPAAGAGARRLNGLDDQGGWDPAWNPMLATTTAALTSALNCATSRSWTATPGANESKPINCVTWFDAFAFCVWDGGFLPTSAQWNNAAAAGAEQRAYPWSNPPSDVMSDCAHTNCLTSCNNGVSPVGSLPLGVGKYGHHDLAGNAGEWGLDWYGGAAPNPCDDCAGLVDTIGQRRLHSGIYTLGGAGCRTGANTGMPPTNRYNVTGIRCARAP